MVKGCTKLLLSRRFKQVSNSSLRVTRFIQCTDSILTVLKFETLSLWTLTCKLKECFSQIKLLTFTAYLKTLVTTAIVVTQQPWAPRCSGHATSAAASCQWEVLKVNNINQLACILRSFSIMCLITSTVLLTVCCSQNQLITSFRNRKLGLISIFPGDWSLDQLPPQKSRCWKNSYKTLCILGFWETKQTSYSEGRYSTPWSPLMKVTFQGFLIYFFFFLLLVLFTFVQHSFSVKASY